MENKQDKWNKLINITNEYDENPEIAQNAISKIEQRKAKRRAKMPLKWLSVAASCIVIIGISVFFACLFFFATIGCLLFAIKSGIYRSE